MGDFIFSASDSDSSPISRRQSGGMSRRDALRLAALGLGAGGALGASGMDAQIADKGGIEDASPSPIPEADINRKDYNGPNVVIIRFGGGVRRREAIDETHTFSPYLLKKLAPEGTLFTNMFYDEGGGFEVGHGQGTLNLLTGHYDHYRDVSDKFLGEGFESRFPTLFEYLRRSFSVADHEALIINGEDRTQEEFYSFSNSHLFGARFRSSVLSLYRYKLHLLKKKLGEITPDHPDFEKVGKAFREMSSRNYRSGASLEQSEVIESFWAEWEHFYGRSGLKNPRGDRLLTELSSWALKRLRPRLMMVNYNDPDYVHWGYMAHYTRAISIIDQGIQRIYQECQADEFYRDNTIFVIAPDCGRDTNPLVRVPCQHHFNTRSSREIFGLVLGPGVARGQVVDRQCEQISLPVTAATIAGIPMTEAEAPVLEEALV